MPLAEAADLVEFLVVDGDPDASRPLRDDHKRAQIWSCRVLDQACCEVLVQGGLNFLGQNRVDATGPRSDRRATFRDQNLERHQEEGTKIFLGL